MERPYRMKWSKEINKMFGSHKAKFFPGRKATAFPGFCAVDGDNGFNGSIWLVTVALKNWAEGLKCPHCGGKPNQDECLTSVLDAETQLGGTDMFDPYVKMECECSDCKKWWTIRKHETETCLDFNSPRDPRLHDEFEIYRPL